MRLFAKKSSICAPVDGVIKSITASSDAMFAEKMLGDGFLVVPSSSDIVAIVDGTITMLFPSLHAFGLIDKEGHEYLIHVGIDTVSLQGTGFTCFVNIGDVVKQKQTILRVDFEQIKNKVPSIDVMVVLCDKRTCKVLQENKVIQAGEENIVIVK